MTAIPSRPIAIDAEESVFEPVRIEKQAVPPKPAPAASSTGWDPYEVWRTRVFAAQGASYKKDRGNT